MNFSSYTNKAGFPSTVTSYVPHAPLMITPLKQSVATAYLIFNGYYHVVQILTMNLMNSNKQLMFIAAECMCNKFNSPKLTCETFPTTMLHFFPIKVLYHTCIKYYT